MSYRPMLIASVFLAVVLVSSSTSSQDVPGALTIGAVLDHLMDQVQQAIDDARNAGSTLEAQAGREAAIAIANAQIALQDSLNNSIKTLNPAIQKDLDQIQSMLATTEFKTNADLQNFTNRLQTLMHSLPFRQHQPQLVKSLPASIVPGRGVSKVRVTFEGSFEDSSKQGFKSSLHIGNKSFDPIENTDNHLVFEIPLDILFQNNGNASANSVSNAANSAVKAIQTQATTGGTSGLDLHSAISSQPALVTYTGQQGCPFSPMAYAPGEQTQHSTDDTAVVHRILYAGSSTRMTLLVPWNESKALGLWHTKNVSRFNVVIDRLPVTPGKLTLVSRSDYKSPVVNEFVSQGYHQASTREAGNDDHKNVPYSVTPHTGWNVVRGTARLVIASQQGEWSYSFGGDDGNHVIFYVTTIHKSWGSSGSVDFSIHFLETRDADCSKTTSTPYVLSWGDSKAIDSTAQNWTLLYDSFDGTHNEFRGSDLHNPYVKVVNQQGGFVIQITDPTAVSWPPKP